MEIGRRRRNARAVRRIWREIAAEVRAPLPESPRAISTLAETSPPVMAAISRQWAHWHEVMAWRDRKQAALWERLISALDHDVEPWARFAAEEAVFALTVAANGNAGHAVRWREGITYWGQLAEMRQPLHDSTVELPVIKANTWAQQRTEEIELIPGWSA
jgi:hypothetical protein